MSVARARLRLPQINLFHTHGLKTLLFWGTAACALALATHWVNRLLAPRPVAVLPATAQAPRSATASQDMARVFGARADGVEANLDGVILTGVFAPQDGKGGFATFRTARGGAGVPVGGEILPGLRLERVEAGRVVVSSGRGLRVLELPRPGSATTSGGALPGTAAPPRGEDGRAVQPGESQR